MGPSTAIRHPNMTMNEHPPIPITIKQFADRLEMWRGMLPTYLQWKDSSRGQGASLDGCDMAGIIPTSQPRFNNVATTRDLNADIPLGVTLYLSAIDIQVALLRTQYYWARYLIYRPYVYKALHHPEQMTSKDAEGAAECLRSALKWPVTMGNVARNKRLIPCPFFWSQNLLGILVLLYLSQQHAGLVQVRNGLLDDGFDADADETVKLYLDWLWELKSVDSAAGWCWGIARSLYGVQD